MSAIEKRMRHQPPKKILIIALRQIGDVLITSPLITKAHETWPEAKIDFLSFNHALGILNGHPYIHEWIGITQRPDFREYWRLFKRLFRCYDLALITQPSDRSHLFGLFAAKMRFGIVPQDQRQGWWKKLLCRHIVPVDYIHQHVVIEKLKLIPGIVLSNSDKISIKPPKSEVLPKDIQALLKKNKKPIIVIHAASLKAYKRILTSTWQQVINQLAENYLICLTGSSSMDDKCLNQEIISGINPHILGDVKDLSGQLNFSQTAYLLHQATLYIGVDTSISHLAAACETKSIVLFGPTPPTNFGPWPNGSMLSQPYVLKARRQTQGAISILQGPGPCVPCRKAGCEDNADLPSHCLYQMTAQDILDAAGKILQEELGHAI